MADDSIQPAELRREDVLTVDDDHFTADSVAIVTGAGSGIGRATAVALAANGLTVAATDIDEEGLAETVEEAERCEVEGTVETVVGNLTNDDDIERIVAESAEYGQVRYLANIAGLQHIDPLPEFPMEKYDLMHDIMLRAPFYLSKLVMPHIRDTDDQVGAIGNMASIHGHIATQDKAGYITSKFGLRGLTQSIAAEGEGTLRAFTISTGYVKTPLVTDQIPDTAEERGITEREVVEDVMLGDARVKEMMEPVEVANLFVLGFSKHGRHLDGGDLTWDGGHLTTY
ncbi:SDR family NAD(P)-dependent oxidoreductase [Haloarchaeobius sp. HME9146]|uniref:SDR family NAD(P)-dependent oxidoreductase n=1 Tax=Haloarchaeobius sp. HME9146 TaxID=2978732 RepID=UPI0021C0DC31|nr:SDR family NAD(P)-dependent oxidoreductase [Haloarchaeobius sp. HME9146]MCT9094849.1 SDR family NAD(P)-dependent oxidoreductase [Haloarchaeobius sp. HME9146]